MANDKNEKTITELYKFLQEHMVTREEFNELQKQMVTREEFQDSRKEMASKIEGLKDHISEKLSDLRGDIVVLMRKEDHKVLHLVKLLKEKNILSDKEVRELIKMEPFPNTAL